jgi:hypothetical protein
MRLVKILIRKGIKIDFVDLTLNTNKHTKRGLQDFQKIKYKRAHSISIKAYNMWL